MSVESVCSEFHLINDGGINRKVAYSRLGELSAKHIFLCLPGLLETRESFHPLFGMVGQFDDCCWICVDYCGRGNSDQLPASEKYSFSKYLADTEDLIENLLQPSQINSNRKLHLIGTSMGGILAMHLVNRLNHKVGSVMGLAVVPSTNVLAVVSMLCTLPTNCKFSAPVLASIKVAK